jgi:hypothetical protein
MELATGIYMIGQSGFGVINVLGDIWNNRKNRNQRKNSIVYTADVNDDYSAPGSAPVSAPGSAPGSAPSSSTSKLSVNYEPQASDLAYLLHDNNEKIYEENISPPPTTPIQVKYIVEKLEEYGTKCIPLKVYVSALLRTWETALLLYLPFLYNKEQPDYSQTLILEVSPFLLETDSVLFKQNSNLPLDFEGNVKEFFKFIKLFIYLNKQGKSYIKGIAEESLKQIPKKFTIILVAGNTKIHLRIDIDGDSFGYYAPNITPYPNSINIPPKTLNKINHEIVYKISTPSDSNLNNKYESYSDDRLKGNPLPKTIYSTFQLWAGKNIHFNDFETIAKFGPDIFSFLKWVIEFKSHPKNTPILFVSHSGTMNEFLKMMISNLNYNYTNTSKNFPPSDKFVKVCEKSRETNTWSLRFKYLGYNVTGFRHAQSCDNMYKNFGGLKSIPGPFTDRQTYGKYTNLSLWGIFSTLIFSYYNKKIISDFNDTQINESDLMILSGMGKQPKDNITTFGINNELTCGDPVSRFSLSSERQISGQPSTASKLTFNQITSVVNTIPPSIPLVEIDIMNITARQRMSNELYSLDNLFKIKFIDCDNSGCKMKVKYIGPYNLSTFIQGDNYDDLTPDDKKIIEALVKRSVIINIYNDSAKKQFVLTLKNVNKGGLVFSKDGTQELQGFFAQKFTKDEKADFKVTSSTSHTSFDSLEKIKISSDFQKSVGFLMGFDLIRANVVTYDIPYNSLILYSNLLIRQLLTTHLLVTSYQEKSNITGFNSSRDETKTFLSKGTAELYGGKKNKKHNKHNKHNNPKK